MIDACVLFSHRPIGWSVWAIRRLGCPPFDGARGPDGDFGIKNKVMTPVLKAPFYAVEVRPTIIGTIKGLKVNEYAQVVNEAGNPIPNLYAVGELIIGNFVNNEYPTTGTVLSAAVYGAKIASDTINAEK